jgi:type I restriction enzyme S subunit
MNEWKETTLGDVVELKRGYDLPARERQEGPYPIISSSGVSGFHNKAMAKAPGVVTGRYGTLGEVFFIRQDYWPLNTSLYVRDFKGNDPRFISYFLRTLDFMAYSDKAAVPGLNRNHLHSAKVRIPPLREQQAIACILGALDDKIELNRRRNRTLEAMARAIFQSWFVDFDPVKAKAAGRTPPGLSPEIAELFPDRFEDSPLGPIPAGWRVGTVGDIVTLSRDAILPGDYADEVFDHYSIPAYDAGQNPLPESGSTIKSQKFIVTDDCVLVSKLNPKTPRVWIPAVDKARRRIASTEFLVCRPKASSDLGRAYFYCLACDKTFSEHLTSRASGTSNSHQRVRPQDFLSYEIPLPAAKLASAFNDKVEPVLDRVLLVKSESRTLAALRDALLPKLISGELRVPDAERIVGRAT